MSIVFGRVRPLAKMCGRQDLPPVVQDALSLRDRRLKRQGRNMLAAVLVERDSLTWWRKRPA